MQQCIAMGGSSKPRQRGALNQHQRKPNTSPIVQACAAEVEAVEDSIEVAKRQTQERELRSALTASDEPHALVTAPWFTVAFDESGTVLVMPWWRGIVIGDIATGKARTPLSLVCVCMHPPARQHGTQIDTCTQEWPAASTSRSQTVLISEAVLHPVCAKHESATSTSAAARLLSSARRGGVLFWCCHLCATSEEPSSYSFLYTSSRWRLQVERVVPPTD